MRKFIAFSVASFLGLSALTSVAQINQGTKFIGGNVGYNSSTSTYTYNNPSLSPQDRETKFTRQEFSITPQVGVFIADNLAMGASIGFTNGKNTNPYYSGSATDTYSVVAKLNSFLIAPFVRYYYLPVENFGFYGQLSAGYSLDRARLEYNTLTPFSEKTTGSGAFANITPALVFFPTNKLGLELTCGSLGYSRTKSETTSSQSSSTLTEQKQSYFGANFGLSSLTLGASYYLGR